ncbi:MAG TPA: DNA-processing protein DprA [Verrucomicrobiales bacterium]|nr:DNA-processing protein DprA [Verrucomicrobiales bacterium]
MTGRESYLALNLLPGIGPVRVRRLLEVFGTPAAILSGSRDQLRRVDGIGNELAGVISSWRDTLDLDEELGLIRDRGVEVLSMADEDYPEPLRQIYDPPLVLYVWGKLDRADRVAVGVVGSRRATHYGIQCARRLSFQLASAGVTVLSGLARGIDTAAHEGALAAKGRTVAVLGSGLAKLYPAENQVLAERIAGPGNGAVVSEFPMRYPPDRQSFPMRNRIVSGWSSGLLVVEAPARSGALITADMAMEQGRNVYAVPGQIDRPASEGTNRLIQQGAKLVLGAEDILDEMGVFDFVRKIAEPGGAIQEESGDSGGDGPSVESRKAGDTGGAGLSEDERALLSTLGDEEWGIEELIDRSGLAASAVSAALMRLELRRLVRQLPGKKFLKRV